MTVWSSIHFRRSGKSHRSANTHRMLLEPPRRRPNTDAHLFLTRAMKPAIRDSANILDALYLQNSPISTLNVLLYCTRRLLNVYRENAVYTLHVYRSMLLILGYKIYLFTTAAWYVTDGFRNLLNGLCSTGKYRMLKFCSTMLQRRMASFSVRTLK